MADRSESDCESFDENTSEEIFISSEAGTDSSESESSDGGELAGSISKTISGPKKTSTATCNKRSAKPKRKANVKRPCDRADQIGSRSSFAGNSNLKIA